MRVDELASNSWQTLDRGVTAGVAHNTRCNADRSIGVPKRSVGDLRGVGSVGGISGGRAGWYCSPRRRMLFHSRTEGLKCVG
jgi:hypothetical protein